MKVQRNPEKQPNYIIIYTKLRIDILGFTLIQSSWRILRMAENSKETNRLSAIKKVREAVFAGLLGVAAIGSIWVSSTLIIHLYKNLY